MKYDIWYISLILKGESIMSSKFLYKINYVSYGSIEKFKARFLVRGFSQREGVDYEETFYLVTRYI
jgi:hypothetical protein